MKQELTINTDKWVDLYADDLYRYAVSRGIGKEEAEDIVQETFLSAYKNIKSFKQKSSLKTWLISILKRKVIDFYRKKYRTPQNVYIDEKPIFQQDGIYKGHWIEEHAPSNWSYSEIPWDNEDFQRIFSLCLEKLPPKYAIIFSMKILQEYESSDICKEMNISPSNFWVIMHRARLQLRECMENNLF